MTTALASDTPDGHERVFPLRDMELLHYYTATVYATISDQKDQYFVWQQVLPQLSFSYPFLLHGLLALSALHRRYKEDPGHRESLMNLARYHQQHALKLYIPLLQCIDEQNCHALFAFSCIIAVICFGILSDDAEDAAPLVARMVDTFDALCGAAVVAVQAYHWLLTGPMLPIMDKLEPPRADLEGTEPGMKAAFEALLDRAEQVCSEGGHTKAGLNAEARRETYRRSIYALATIITPAVYKNRPLSVVISWPIMAEASYVALLRHRDPLAVVILGHYGVALHKVDNVLWVLEGLGFHLTETVAREVGEEWAPHLTWARARVAEAPTPASHITPGST